MNVTKKIKLDFGKTGSPIQIFAKQGDKDSRYVEVTPLIDGEEYSIPEGIDVLFGCLKPDGHQVVIDGSTSKSGFPKVENNKIIVEFTEQTLMAAGEAIASVILMDKENEKILSTANFYILIEASAIVKGLVESSDEYQAYLSALMAVEEALKNAQEYVNSALAEANTNLNEAIGKANVAIGETEAATFEAEEATEKANIATENANTATERANEAAENAENVISNYYDKYESDKRYAPSIVETASGETILIEDSANVPLQGLKVFGKSQYAENINPNLYNIQDINTEITKIEYTVDEEGWITVTLTDTNTSSTSLQYYPFVVNLGSFIKPSTVYSLVGESFTEDIDSQIQLTLISYSNAGKSVFTYKTGNPMNVVKNGISVNQKATIDDFSEKTILMSTAVKIAAGQTGTIKFRISVIEGDGITAENFKYQPFNNGVTLLPNPEQPIAIKSLSNTEVKLRGKNLFNIKDCLNATGWTENNGVYTGSIYELYTYLQKNKLLNVLRNYNGQVYMSFTGRNINTTSDYKMSLGLFVQYTDLTSDRIVLDSSDLITKKFTSNKQKKIKVAYISYFENIEVELQDLQIQLLTDDTSPVEYVGNELTVPYELRGIPVSSGGNYTDENGQQWVADYVDFERGKLVKLVNYESFTNSNGFSFFGRNEQNGGGYRIRKNLSANNINSALTYCNCCKYGDTLGHVTGNYFQISSAFIWFYFSSIQNIDELNAFFNSGKTIDVLYQFATPIETDLTLEELENYKKIYSYKPITTVLTDTGAGVIINYGADTKLYCDLLKNQINELKETILQLGGSM